LVLWGGGEGDGVTEGFESADVDSLLVVVETVHDA
jgi:hypothetical protein